MIAANNPGELYTGDGVNPTFPYTFKIFDASHLKVVKADTNGVESTLTLNVDYLVSDVGVDAGGNVTYPLAGQKLQVGEKLSIELNVPEEQKATYKNLGVVWKTLEDSLDKFAQILQKHRRDIDRSPKVAVTSGLTGDQLISDITAAKAAAEAAQVAAEAARDIAITAAMPPYEPQPDANIGAGGAMVPSAAGSQIHRVQSTGGKITFSDTPFGVDITNMKDGQVFRIEGLSDVNTLVLKHKDLDYGCILNGDIVIKKGTVIDLSLNLTLKRFVQASRNGIEGI